MITLRTATPPDAEAIAKLLAEMNRFYGGPDVDSADQRIAAVRDAIFGTHPAAHVLLAWKHAQLVGMAAFSFLWPASGVTRSLYLKELYVAEGGRRQGVGRLLMHQLCNIARDSGCSRVEWTADTQSLDAQRFYAALGVSHTPSKLFYRLDGDTLLHLAAAPVEHRRR